MLNFGSEISTKLNIVAECSRPGPGVTRLPFTQDHQKALALLKDWMIEAGLDVSLDNAGTLIGKKQGQNKSKTLFLGSHQDSVPQGGRFDGILGIILPIIVMKHLKELKPACNIEILAFADEEGVRFPTALMGPRVLAGTFDNSNLQLNDNQGISLKKAMNSFGLDPDQLTGLKRNPEEILGYIETHIEQGPVLEQQNRSCGVVSAICGIERWRYNLTGEAAHAGTTPMEYRKDALAAAAQIISLVENISQQTEKLLGVVGELNVQPNAVNAIPGNVSFQLELRSEQDETRHDAAISLLNQSRTIAAKRGIRLEAERTYSQNAVLCDTHLIAKLQNASKSLDGSESEILVLPSGATHDASAMADLCPIAMLFVQCKNGISHNPEEYADETHINQAANLLAKFIQELSI